MIYRVVIIDNGNQVSLTYKKQGGVSSMDLEGNIGDEARLMMEQALDKLMEVKDIDSDDN